MDTEEGHPPDGLTTVGAEASSPHEMAAAGFYPVRRRCRYTRRVAPLC